MRNLKGIRLYQDDLSEDLSFKRSVAIDTETMGLHHRRDRLCLIQISEGDGICHLVQIAPTPRPAPRLHRLLLDKNIEKIFHFARFDLTALYCGLGVLCEGPLYCTKIASQMARTYSDHHGLRTLCRELLGVEISKAEQSSNWGSETLTDAQKAYAASDVLYLHRLKACLTEMLMRESRYELFQDVCRFLPTRVKLDLRGFPGDTFAH